MARAASHAASAQRIWSAARSTTRANAYPIPRMIGSRRAVSAVTYPASPLARFRSCTASSCEAQRAVQKRGQGGRHRATGDELVEQDGEGTGGKRAESVLGRGGA